MPETRCLARAPSAAQKAQGPGPLTRFGQESPRSNGIRCRTEPNFSVSRSLKKRIRFIAGVVRGGASACLDRGGRAVFRAEHRGAGDQPVGTLFDHERSGFAADAAVDLDMDPGIDLVGHGAQFADLGHDFGHERLSAETRFDRHHEDEVDFVKQFFDRGRGRFGLDRNAHRGALFSDGGDDFQRIVVAFDMERDMVGSGIHERFDILERVGKHQMRVERQRGMFAQGGDQRGTDRQVRHKMSVHHIQMEEIGSGFFDALDLIGEEGEIGGQQGRRHQNTAGIKFGKHFFHVFILSGDVLILEI